MISFLLNFVTVHFISFHVFFLPDPLIVFYFQNRDIALEQYLGRAQR